MNDLFENTAKRKGLIDVEIWERLAGLRIAGETHQVLYVVLAKTYGYGMNKNCIENAEFVELTGLGVTNVLRGLKNLQNMGIIYKEKVGKKNYFTVVKETKKWQQIINIDNAVENSEKNQKNALNSNKNVEKKDVKIIKNDNAEEKKEIINIDNAEETLKNNTKINNNLDLNKQIINIDNKQEIHSKINENLNEYEITKKSYYNNIYINNNKINIEDINNKKSLLNSTSESKRLLGYWCALFQAKFNNQFKCNFKKDMSIINRIFATYGELKTAYIIKEFFRLATDQDAWQFNKFSLEVLEMSCNQIVTTAVNKRKALEKQKEQIQQIQHIDIKEEKAQDIVCKDVNFNVMMTDLKKKYGLLEAYKHIEEYKKNWKNELIKIIRILKNVIEK